MVKDDRYKLIEYVVDGRRTTQLFDLERDPLECRNLAGEACSCRPACGPSSQAFPTGGTNGDDADSEWGRAFWGGYDA